jgi:hypothetical protein
MERTTKREIEALLTEIDAVAVAAEKAKAPAAKPAKDPGTRKPNGKGAVSPMRHRGLP